MALCVRECLDWEVIIANFDDQCGNMMGTRLRFNMGYDLGNVIM